MGMNYILDEEGKPQLCKNIIEWAEWFEGQDRHVAKDEFSVTRVLDGDVVTEKILVSTVFLGLDHSFGDGPPVLWETMVFNGEHDQDQWRYTSQEEAIAGHSHAVQVAKGEVKDDRE